MGGLLRGRSSLLGSGDERRTRDDEASRSSSRFVEKQDNYVLFQLYLIHAYYDLPGGE